MNIDIWPSKRNIFIKHLCATTRNYPIYPKKIIAMTLRTTKSYLSPLRKRKNNVRFPLTKRMIQGDHDFPIGIRPASFQRLVAVSCREEQHDWCSMNWVHMWKNTKADLYFD